MLPSDSDERRKAAAAEEKRKLSQTFVDDHYKIQTPEDKPIRYTHEIFQEAAIQWLVETDQVRQHVHIHSPCSLFFPPSTAGTSF